MKGLFRGNLYTPLSATVIFLFCFLILWIYNHVKTQTYFLLLSLLSLRLWSKSGYPVMSGSSWIFFSLKSSKLKTWSSWKQSLISAWSKNHWHFTHIHSSSSTNNQHSASGNHSQPSHCQFYYRDSFFLNTGNDFWLDCREHTGYEGVSK